MRRERRADRLATFKAFDRTRTCRLRGNLGGQIILGRGGFQLFELKFQLIEPPGTLGGWPELVPLVLGDQQPQLLDQRLGA